MRLAVRWVRPRTVPAVLLACLLAVAVVSFGPLAPAATASVTSPVPPSVVKTAGTVAIRTTCGVGGPVTLGICAAGAVACILWCDDALTWIDGRTGNQLSDFFNDGGQIPGSASNSSVYFSDYPPNDAPHLSHTGVRSGSPWLVAHQMPNWEYVSAEVLCKSSVSGDFYVKPDYNINLLRGDEDFPRVGVGYCTEPGDMVYRVDVWATNGTNGPSGAPHVTWEAQTAERTAKLRVVCKLPDGTTATAESVSFVYEMGQEVTTPALPSCESILPGSYREQVVIIGAPADADPDQEEGRVTVDAAEYSDCLVGPEACELDVWVNAQKCVPGVADCIDWVTKTDTNTYTCKWGPYAMPLSDCEATIGTKYNPVTNPTATAAPQPWPSPMPTSTATSNPTLTPQPSPSLEPRDPTASPSVEPTPGGEGAPDPADEAGNECWPSGWGVFNPLEWVYRPTVCALKWAFVPPSGTWTDTMGPAFNDWRDSPFGQWNTSLGGVVGAFAGFDDEAAGCEGPQLSGDVSGVAYDLQPMNACAEPLSTVAAVTKGLLTVIVGFGGAFLIIDPIFAALGLGVKPRWEQGELF